MYIKKIFIILLIIFFAVGTACAYRIGKPQKITALDEGALVVINEALENLWDITNGRYSLNVVTTNPDGTTSGGKGDMLLYDAGASEYLEINVDGGTTWRGVALTDTP